MNKRDLIYEELKKIAEKYDIEFDSQFIHLGRAMDCGELCVEYSDKEGYILFAYDRNIKSYYFSTKDIEEFKYVVFSHLCSHSGFKYEQLHRERNLQLIYGNDNLQSDTRKVAFEYTLYQLNKINPEWFERSIEKYEELLNKRYSDKKIRFNRENMKFYIVM